MTNMNKGENLLLLLFGDAIFVVFAIAVVCWFCLLFEIFWYISFLYMLHPEECRNPLCCIRIET